jgi:hypothetical protein
LPSDRHAKPFVHQIDASGAPALTRNKDRVAVDDEFTWSAFHRECLLHMCDEQALRILEPPDRLLVVVILVVSTASATTLIRGAGPIVPHRGRWLSSHRRAPRLSPRGARWLSRNDPRALSGTPGVVDLFAASAHHEPTKDEEADVDADTDCERQKERLPSLLWQGRQRAATDDSDARESDAPDGDEAAAHAGGLRPSPNIRRRAAAHAQHRNQHQDAHRLVPVGGRCSPN